MNAANGVAINGANIKAKANLTLNAYGTLPDKTNTILIQGSQKLAESGNAEDYRYAMVYQPSKLMAKNNIEINTLQQTGNNRLTIKGSELNAENGQVIIAGYGDVNIENGKDEYYLYHKFTENTGKWYNRKKTTKIAEHQIANAAPAVLRGKTGVTLTAGNQLNLYATELHADKGKIQLTAGKQLSLYAVEEVQKSHTQKDTTRRILKIKTSSSHKERNLIINESLPTKLAAQSANLKSGWDTLLQGTQFHTTLSNAIIQARGEKKRVAMPKFCCKALKPAYITKRKNTAAMLRGKNIAAKG